MLHTSALARLEQHPPGMAEKFQHLDRIVRTAIRCVDKDFGAGQGFEQALAGHPRVRALEERPTLAEPIDTFLTTGASGLARLARLRAEEAATWRRRYWAGVRAEGIETAGAVFVDKAPGETANLVLMGRLFPRAKFLFALIERRVAARKSLICWFPTSWFALS